MVLPFQEIEKSTRQTVIRPGRVGFLPANQRSEREQDSSIAYTAAAIVLSLNLLVLLERPALAQPASRTFIPLGAYGSGNLGNAAWFVDQTQQKVYLCIKASVQGGFSCEGIAIGP
jgi:hypothetical protein